MNTNEVKAGMQDYWTALEAGWKGLGRAGSGLIEDDPTTDASSGGGGTGSTYGVDQMQTPYGAPGYAAPPTFDEMPPDNAIVQVETPPGYPPLTAGQAMMAVAKFVASQPQILAMVQRLVGAVVRPAPTHSGGQAMDTFALELMFEHLPDVYEMPIAQYLAGFEAPLGLSKEQQLIFLSFKVLDAMEVTGARPRLKR